MTDDYSDLVRGYLAYADSVVNGTLQIDGLPGRVTYDERSGCTCFVPRTWVSRGFDGLSESK